MEQHKIDGKSPSSRRAWIEISPTPRALPGKVVALLAEGVDRNFSRCRNAVNIVVVALLAEGVDRNLAERVVVGSGQVALLAEGVDRNCAAAMT